MDQKSPMAKKFDELVKGSGVWGEVIADYKPYDSFDIELNVPKAMMGNPDVFVPGCVSLNFEGYLTGIATYKAAYPGMEPKRYQAFVLTPALHLVPHYPISSMNDFELARSDDERYFTSLVDMINCYTHCTENRVTVMSIENQEFGCRTAQEMIDYFKQFDVSGSTYKSALFPRPTSTPDSK